MDLTFKRVFLIKATLRVVSPNAYFYVEEGLTVSQQELEASATEFEARIVPAVRRYVNPAWQPGAGIDTRVTVLHAMVAGAAGYMTSLDLLPKSVYPNSNERPVVYMSLLSNMPGTPGYYQVLTHEAQHLAQQQSSPYQDTWIQEGMSELVSELAGYKAGSGAGFLDAPDTSLVNWDVPDPNQARHYGAAYLFLKYVGGQIGYETLLPVLASGKATGMDAMGEALANAGDPRSPEEALRDWTIANAVGGAAGVDQRYAYPAPGPGTVRVQLAPEAEGGRAGDVSQYAAGYVELRPSSQARTITFQGAVTTPLLPTTPPSGERFWWSNRGDHVASTMTRQFALHRVEKASLRFKIWHDLEEQFDFAFVLASKDGGETWDILSGRHTTTKNDMGKNFGPAYTGTSGKAPTWEDEEMDLSPYAGGRMLVRFLYVSDEGVNNAGLALDDITIPEIGFQDDAETGSGGWVMDGFVRTLNAVPQRFFVTVIDREASAVEEVHLDAFNRGAVGVPAGRTTVLAVTAMAPATSVRAAYQYTVEAKG